MLISPEESVSHQGPLVNQVRQISEALTRNVGLNSPSELSDALARLAIDVLKVEKELRLKQVHVCPSPSPNLITDQCFHGKKDFSTIETTCS